MLERWAPRAEAALERLLPPPTGPAASLAEAMRYASLGGGKRLRAALVYSAGDMLGGDLDALDHAAAAVEMIHAYSLVHDDLPAMDDDDLRRGKPTCHKVYGEAAAILAGDALQSRAFEILALPGAGSDPAIRAAMVHTLARASGVDGMAGGQALDLAAVGASLSVDALATMHGLKTGALIRASVRLGAQCAAADAHTLDALDAFADKLGFAFQIVDDILDEVMDSETLGKTGGADRARDKPTYTSMLGLEQARQTVHELHRGALESLATIRHNTAVMNEIADFVVERRF